ncbi:MAG: LacI family transcriptional regulator, partial [Treponema sp.]|nr:LacI family transcriptional regulator [Treponema sp.]
VLSKPYLVNERTRKKVLLIIEKHSFVPNALAQGLAGMPTKIIGVMVDEFANDFYIELTNGIDNVLTGENYSVQLMSSRWEPERELRGIRSFLLSRVDGILMAPFSAESEATDLLKNSGVPHVLINVTSSDPAVSYVCGDSYKGGQLAASYVKRLDQEQVITVDVSEHWTVKERLRGFRDAFGTKLIGYHGVKTMDDGRALVPAMIARDGIDRKNTTLFVANDYIAFGVLAGLYEHKIAIPRQLSIIAYDDIRIASMCRTPLTTISQSIYHMGKIAAQALIALIRNPQSPPRRHIIEPSLIVRESTSSPR